MEAVTETALIPFVANVAVLVALTPVKTVTEEPTPETTEVVALVAAVPALQPLADPTVNVVRVTV